MSSPNTPPDKPQPLSIPYPPDYIFKYRNKNRIAPAQEVMQQQQAMFVFQRMEYPETGGQLAYFEGVPYPAKGHPFPEAIYAINFIKRMTRNAMVGFANKDLWKEYIAFFLSSKKNKIGKVSRFLELYCDLAVKVSMPYILEERYLSPCPKEILSFTGKLLTKWGVEKSLAEQFAEQFANQIEYDNAYRFRIEDAMSETTKEKLIRNSRKELVRLAELLLERQPIKETGLRDVTGNRLKKVLHAMSWLLIWPAYKKIFTECIEESNFENFQLDDADRYHVLLWADYNFLGKTLDERITMYSEIHKDGFPPRLLYTPA